MISEPGHFHAVRFYKDADGLSAIVADFLREGFAAGQPAIVLATKPHVDKFNARLAASGCDPDRLAADGKLIVADAHRALDDIMVGGMPDGGRFRGVVVPLIEAAVRGRRHIVVRAYGELVDVLWKRGESAAAIRLETLWNTLANTHQFSLLCGYAMGSFYKNAAVEEICSHHTHVVSHAGDAAPLS